jgi:hypothetical protein
MQRKRSSNSPFKQTVGASDIENADTMPPIFSFERMESGSGYSVTCCDADNQAAALRRIFLLSKMKWREIQNAPRHGLGTEKIARSALRAPLPKTLTDDVTFLAIRYNGLRPMVGYRDGRIFHIVFLDHTFDVYDHG